MPNADEDDTRAASRRNIQKLLKSNQLLQAKYTNKENIGLNHDGRISEHIEEFRQWPLSQKATSFKVNELTGAPYPLYLDPESSLPVSNYQSENHSSYYNIDINLLDQSLPAGNAYPARDSPPSFFVWQPQGDKSDQLDETNEHG